MSELAFRLSKTLTGKLNVHYQCPKCKEGLKNSLDDAGATDTCPKCNSSFVVPGAAKKKEFEIEQRRREAEEKAKKIEKLKEREEQKQAAIQVMQMEEQKEEAVNVQPTPVVPTNTARPSAKFEYPAIEIPIRRTFSESLLAVFGLVQFVWFTLFIFNKFERGMGRRFQDDNAIGATANATELGVLALAAWLNAIFVVLIFIYIKVSQQTRIQAIEAMKDEFR